VASSKRLEKIKQSFLNALWLQPIAGIIHSMSILPMILTMGRYRDSTPVLSEARRVHVVSKLFEINRDSSVNCPCIIGAPPRAFSGWIIYYKATMLKFCLRSDIITYRLFSTTRIAIGSGHTALRATRQHRIPDICSMNIPPMI
jgi:hypothetical protein